MVRDRVINQLVRWHQEQRAGVTKSKEERDEYYYLLSEVTFDEVKIVFDRLKRPA